MAFKVTENTEINYLWQLSHLNLVELIGYCLEDEQQLLVYEFVHEGSRENYLFRSEYINQDFIENLRRLFVLLFEWFEADDVQCKPLWWTFKLLSIKKNIH
ncbi:unnamed protein product [Eruca vesicaria subsp. sativa]|uniref:Serine-threonine/tyrosine-protein kinase catalytic domain-containing protein n=1 Tax=Eruca vesicaria subsp. sativa TaxID=29727 RepID=A0ABC8KLS6_ERUVS|nr:unnamed protein product [Eruca vesicaria subsp. sativa]